MANDFLSQLLQGNLNNTNQVAQEMTPDEVETIRRYLGEPQGMADSLAARSGQGLKLPEIAPVAEIPAVGMAESLRQRSGDDMVKPSLPTLASTGEPAPDLFRKENIVEEARPVAPQEESETDTELNDAMRRRDNLLAMMMMGKGAEKVGTAFSGTQSDKEYLDLLKPMAETKVGDVLTKRKAASDKIDLETKKFNFAFAKDKDDPNSPSSRFYRDTLKELASGANLGLKIPDNLSAAEMERVYPNIINIVNAKEARLARLEQAKLMAQGKTDKEAQKKEGKQFEQEKKLRDEVRNADKDTNFSTTKYSYENLKNAMDSGKWSGIDDVAAIYGFIKALDPGSVVRESETELILSAQSPLAKYGNIFRKVTRGDLASPQYRKKLLDAFGKLYEERKKQFEFKVNPTVNAANKYGLDTSNVLMEEVPGLSLTNQKPKSNEVERTTKDGRTAIFDADTKKFLRYKD